MQTVKDTYNQIADEFDNTRKHVWNCTRNFLDKMNVNQCGLEIGCGNGKNMMYNLQLNIKGIDICDKFIDLCKKKNLNVELGDMMCLTYDNDTFDYVYSVAVLHHIDTKDKRINAINEMFRVCKNNGHIFITVWSFTQPDNAKRKFTKTDEMVSWKSNNNTYFRFYHLYLENELLDEFNSSNYKFNVINYYYELGNWILHIQKNEI